MFCPSYAFQGERGHLNLPFLYALALQYRLSYSISISNKQTKIMRKASVLSFEVKEPHPIPIKILSQFRSFEHPIEPKSECVLASMFLYTQNAVYRGWLKKGDINNQLSWNSNSVSTIIDSLSGKRTNIDLRFDQELYLLTLICQIETGIRVTMFEIVFERLKSVHPLQHFKNQIRMYRQLYLEHENSLQQQRDKIATEIKNIKALKKRVQDQADTEIVQTKKNFVDVINQCKKQLRKHMSGGISQIPEEEEETMTRGRRIVKVNRQALDRQANSKQDIQSEQKGFQQLFD